jgi:hypothetical protein
MIMIGYLKVFECKEWQEEGISIGICNLPSLDFLWGVDEHNFGRVRTVAPEEFTSRKWEIGVEFTHQSKSVSRDYLFHSVDRIYPSMSQGHRTRPNVLASDT